MNSDPGKFRAIGRCLSTLALVALAFLTFCGVVLAGTVEHPGVLPQGAECTSCHATKVSGKSVHSVMGASCTVCHLATTKGDMTLMSLSMAKEKICSACHEESAALRQHVPAVKGRCVQCHDAHSSDRKMLLLSQLKSKSTRNIHPLN
jgi:predicted CXXCH cytochrome family protein